MKRSNLILGVAMSLLLATGAQAATDELTVVNKAKELISSKKYTECEELLTNALKELPESLRVKNALGQAMYKNGKLSEASSIFSQVLGKDPENSYAKTMMETIRKEKLAASSPIANIAGDNAVSNDSFEQVSKEKSGSESYGIKFNVSNQLSKEEQEALAKKCYDEMIPLSKWDIADITRLHIQVIEKCPLTDKAQESCWRLSNLYILAVEPAEYENCISVLEHLLKQYPDTPLMPDAKNRLISVCSQINDYSRLCKLYEELFQKDPEPDDKTFMIRALDYGNALVGAGKKEDAKGWYNKVLEKDKGRNNLEARVARDKLAEL